MIIGVTGKSGTGKTTVANYLGSALDFKVIHGDELAHEVLDLAFYNEVLSWFSFKPVAEVDRKRLGKLLFQDEQMLAKYNAIMDKKILELFSKKIKNTQNYIIDWNFLSISKLFNLCDKKILLIASDEERKNRVLKRDNIGEDYFNMRDKASLEYDSALFDFVWTSEEVLNDKSILERLVN